MYMAPTMPSKSATNLSYNTWCICCAYLHSLLCSFEEEQCSRTRLDMTGANSRFQMMMKCFVVTVLILAGRNVSRVREDYGNLDA